MHALIALSVLAVLSVLSATAAHPSIYGNCLSTTDAVYSLPDTPLSILNPWLTSDPSYAALVAPGCSQARPATRACHDKPALGSGLAQLQPHRFLGLTDRGPSLQCATLFESDAKTYAAARGKEGTAFPVPSFAPTIAHFQPDRDSRRLNFGSAVPLRASDGHPVSGIPNGPADDTPYGPACEGPPLAYDPSGLDTEDLAHIDGTDYVAIAEEYSPSVVLANFRTGEVIARHVPVSVAPLLAEARYPVVGDLPDVFTNRRRNRGFEAVVVDKLGKYVIAIIQSPMLGQDDSDTMNNAIIRCAYFNLTVSGDGTPSLSYAKSFIIQASSPAAYEMENVPMDIKYSGADYFATGKFIALERAKGQVKLFLVDFSEATNIDETKYADNLGLEMETNGIYKASQFGVIPADKTLIWDSANVVGGSEGFTGGSKQEGFVLDLLDPTKVWMIDDNDFGLENKGNAQMRKISLGRAPEGTTVCKVPEHPIAPTINIEPSKTIKLTNSKTYRISDQPGAGAAENLDVDEEGLRAYVANDLSGSVDMYDISTSPATPISSYKARGPYKPTSVSVCKEYDAIAVGLDNFEDDAGPGRVDILSKNLTLFRTIEDKECVLPDDVEWSSDCQFLVAACEGEGADIPGGVLVADFGGPPGSRFRGYDVAGFKGYDRIAHILMENGIRLVESQTPSVDLEPEYVTIEGKNAFVVLQEANAIAVVDLYEAKITELKPIGFIDRSRAGFALDASNRDDGINIRNYPFLFGMPQPDTIQSYVAADGATYLVFANEGDSKEEAEEARGGDITDREELNRIAIPGLKQLVEDPALLGRLKFSTIMGYNESTNTQEKMFHFGSRSFSIMSLNGTVVFDSGDWFERIEEKHFPTIFNANTFDEDDLSLSQADLFDERSDDKGMEPESLSLMTKGGATYAFIGFERPSIITVFEMTNPSAPIFVDAVQNHPFNEPTDVVFAEGRQGDLDPEGIFPSAKLGKLFVSGSVSNTLSSYDIEI